MRTLTRVFGPEPLSRLVRAHAASTAADACFTVSLAGSLFFSVSVDAARPRLALYLLVTLAPFAIVTPFVGPVADRFRDARPAFISFTGQARAVLSLFIAVDLKNLLLYPWAFGVLVLGKAYSIGKSSLVPALVPDHDELVAANSRMSRVGAISAAAGGGVGALTLTLAGPTNVLRVAAVLHLLGAALALQIPRRPLVGAVPQAVPEPEPEPLALERLTDLETPAPARAPLMGMMALRASVGLVTFLLAFGLRRAAEPTIFFGLVALAAAVGHFLGTLVSPVLRRNVVDERWVVAAATAYASAAVVVAGLQLGRFGMLFASASIALAANVGRQGFDSLLQRETPDEARSRVFARVEALLQFSWVVGALIPTVFALTTRAGLFTVGLLMGAITLVVLRGERRQVESAPPSA